jgi:hypothetical protein
LYVRGRGNVAKRVLLQAAAFNLALILRTMTRAGTPRGLADLKRTLLCALLRVLAALLAMPAPLSGLDEVHSSDLTFSEDRGVIRPKLRPAENRTSDTGF